MIKLEVKGIQFQLEQKQGKALLYVQRPDGTLAWVASRPTVKEILALLAGA